MPESDKMTRGILEARDASHLLYESGEFQMDVSH